MAYRRKGQRSKLLDLAKKSRERAQARRDAKAKRVGGKKYVTPVAKRKSPAQAKDEMKEWACRWCLFCHET